MVSNNKYIICDPHCVQIQSRVGGLVTSCACPGWTGGLLVKSICSRCNKNVLQDQSVINNLMTEKIFHMVALEIDFVYDRVKSMYIK